MMNFLSDDLRRDPYPLYEQVRSNSPLLHEPQSDMWLVFGYESVKRVLTDHEAFSSIVTPPTGKAPDWLVFSDPPRHTRLCGIIMRTFTPQSIANLEPRIRELSREAPAPGARATADGPGRGLLEPAAHNGDRGDDRHPRGGPCPVLALGRGHHEPQLCHRGWR
ncbi:MAG TPA: hypothetical protein VNA24_30510 [Hyalangium sp.]|nr:hypothetical protein [Hyalangium sp.]